MTNIITLLDAIGITEINILLQSLLLDFEPVRDYDSEYLDVQEDKLGRYGY